MKNKRSLTTIEILGIAIQSEIESARYYQSIRAAVRSRLLKDKMSFLASEERKHRRILTEYYYQKFPNMPLSRPAKSPIPKPDIFGRGKTTVSGAFEAAMRSEKKAEDFYRVMATNMNDAQGTLLLKYLAKVENSHYQLLYNDLELIRQAGKLKQLTILYQSDENIHIGP